METTNFVEILVGLVIVCLGTAGAYIITTIASYYKSKKQEITNNISAAVNKTNNTNIDTAIKRVMTIVDNVVNALNETYKKELLEACEDGKLGEDEKKMLRNKALQLINAEVGDGIKDILKDVVGNFDEWVKTLIELAVTAAKPKKRTTKSTTEK